MTCSFFFCKFSFFLPTLGCRVLALLFEEVVAGTDETLPKVRNAFRNGTDGFPFLLYLHEFVGRGFPVRTVFQCLGLFAEFRFLGQVLSLFLFQAFEECRLFREEPVACATETLENLRSSFEGRNQWYAIPLHLDDLLRLCLPMQSPS